MINSEISIEQNINNVSDLVRNKLNGILDYKDIDKNAALIVDAMRYMMLGDGKMLRPFMIYATHSIFSNDYDEIINLAMAVEMIHSYTLIHDDLPAMDDDDYRRGVLSCHKKFDEATAILCGDSLLTYAFEILSGMGKNIDNKIVIRVISEISRLIGYKGLVAGQILDLLSKNISFNDQELEKIKILKTSNLFIASCKSVGIINNIKEEEIVALENFASLFGVIYQVKDDIKDNEHNLNKFQLNDILNESLNYLDIFGTKAVLLKSFTKYCFEF
ncbi:MAG: geranylgeranyl pyrophosphate synthase [Candidatus Midichloriaceae bacterium]|jgi:geranylgeranyl pyrophosphate synthase